ncbi:MAG: type II secretion system F family protein [Acetobacteraceae bacterium]
MTDDRALMAVMLAGLAVVLVGAAAVLLLRDLAARNLEQRVMSLSGGQSGMLHDTSLLGVLRRMLRWIGDTVRGRTRFYSERDLLALEGMIAGSGFNPQAVLPMLLGLKVLLAIGIPAAAFLYARIAGLSGAQQFVALCVSIPVGLLGPDWVLTFLRRPYLAALRRGVPDALDLLVVCTEAGMALENALEHVSGEIRHSNPAISVALTKLLDEIRVLPDRRDAFRNFAERSGVEGARRVATMLGQAMQYGTPLSQALRTVAMDLRRERMIALEAKAARLPVLLVMPLILFIMPSLFIVLTGPAILRLMDSLHAAIAR